MTVDPNLRVDDFRYFLPEALIAQEPPEQRDQSRLLAMSRRTGQIEHCHFRDISKFLHAGDVLVTNDVRVIPARIFANRYSGASIEVFVLDGFEDGPEHRVLLKPARRIKIDEVLILLDDARLRVIERNDKEFVVRMEGSWTWSEYLNRHGLMPLPPYIKRDKSDARSAEDKERYQTVYASRPGAVAAPTAGLHFSHDLLDNLRQNAVKLVTVTLWVGWGTFKPVECERVMDHVMDTEFYSVPVDTADAIRSAKLDSRRIFAVGTTTTRALESWARLHQSQSSPERQKTDLFITPGYDFNLIDGLVTNFHLPGSSLIMLVSAFAGREPVLNAYKIAVENQYRFYSYGDAMLIY